MKRDRLALVGLVLILLAAGGWFFLHKGKKAGKGKSTEAAAKCASSSSVQATAGKPL